MIYPNTGLAAPIVGVFIGLGIGGFFATAYYGLVTLYHALKSDLSTAWGAYGTKTKQVLGLFLAGVVGAVATSAYRWLVYGY
jgi:hypothetical protein